MRAVRAVISNVIQIVILLGVSMNVIAKDLGKHGATFSIKEEDPIKYIKNRLKALEESGELLKHQQLILEKTKTKLKHPKAVEGIVNTTEEKVFYYDPAYILNEDLKDHQGKIIYKKGHKVNPLAEISFGPDMLFINGEDEAQVTWAINYGREPFVNHSCSKTTSKIILTKGSPIDLEEKLGVKFYFDQAGSITSKLGIKQVPSVVSQDNLRLKIQEIKLGKGANV